MTTVCALTVTYGNRTELLRQTLSQAFKAGAAEAIVVVNGCGADVAIEVAQIAASSTTPITVVESPTNLGSAGGFAIALSTAYRDSSSDYFWLLDDDNFAQEDSLKNGLRALRNLRLSERVALVFYRERINHHRLIKAGMDASDVFPQPGSAMHLDIWRRVAARLRGRNISTPAQSLVEVPCAPYGGLLAHREDLLGQLPRQDFVLYEDDHEFTMRLGQSGVAFVLAMDCVLVDADLDAPDTPAVRGIVRLLRTDSQFAPKMYYQVRNTIYLDARRNTSVVSKVRFIVNLTAFVSVLTIYAAADRRNRSNYRLLVRAIFSGLFGRMGDQIPLQTNS